MLRFLGIMSAWLMMGTRDRVGPHLRRRDSLIWTWRIEGSCKARCDNLCGPERLVQVEGKQWFPRVVLDHRRKRRCSVANDHAARSSANEYVLLLADPSPKQRWDCQWSGYPWGRSVPTWIKRYQKRETALAKGFSAPLSYPNKRVSLSHGFGKSEGVSTFKDY